jgi:NADP-dependent 3-hydroxy acid dehydrogenase YdfG
VSPHPVLVPAVQDTLDEVVGGGSGAAVGTLRRDDGGEARMLAAIGDAWVHGAPVDWSSVFAGAQTVDLPTYAFQRERFWPAVSAPAAAEPVPALLREQWEPLAEAPLPTESPPVIYEVPSDGDARDIAVEVLDVLQRWLADDTNTDSRLVVLTRDPHQGPVWGLVRSAQSEDPGRLVLVDTDGSDESTTALPSAGDCGESEVVVRDGQLRVRRLVHAADPDAGATPRFDPDGTVLITGGTGTLGGIVARHLARTHGVRSFLLTSRRGSDAPGAQALVADLEAAGAATTIAACDVADRDALAAAIGAAVPPVRAIIHTAGLLADGVIGSTSPERFDAVWGPKADGARNLHELAGDLDLDLTAFVVFSSTAGILGAAGQANYAAASVYLDGLVAQRQAQGLPATSLAWGLWQEASGLTGDLDDTDLARMRRTGVVPLSTADALDLFDRAVQHDGVVVPLGLDLAAVRRAAGTMPVPGVWRRLLGDSGPDSSSDTSDAGAALARQLADVTESDRQRVLVDLVRAEASAVLGHSSPAAVEPTRAFKDLGFDSLTAVELRNRLGLRTGLRLATTLVFDHPTAERLALELGRRLEPTEATADEEALRHLAKLEALLGSVDADGAAAHDLRTGLRRALAKLADGDAAALRSVEDQLAGADAEQVLDFIDREFGSSASQR